MLQKLIDIYQCRELFLNFTRRELKLKYRNSALGFLWSLLNPIMMLIIYYFAFKVVLRIQIDNYSVFLLSGLLPWSFFQSSIILATSSIVNSGHLIKKVYFPREIIVLSVVSSNFVNFLITLFVLIFASSFIFKIQLSIYFMGIIVALLVLYIFTLGISLITSSLYVYYRDISYILEIIFLIFFYATPIIYSMDMIPEVYRKIILLNPMATIIQMFRNTIMYQSFLSLSLFLMIFLVSIVVLCIGYLIFTKVEPGFAEEI